MLRYYRLDLWAELDGPRLPFRRLRVLLEQLPPDSATIRAELGPQAGWSATDELLVSVWQELAGANWQRADPKRRPRRPPARPVTPWTQAAVDPRRTDPVALARQLMDRRKG